ncbi:fasciclin domain-containing protein [Echinicola strongylocentroti]|uniref:Fasciclin domain-containing protein n=1 Tax=Echinicola strongylocentroti TaxID=1795355 RepID=A0A2Z4IRY6_9BACT|nr:fasciclin domain-containing protein [Echinicola strongylocentroti]AWW33336.1 fasciclin domain-containing protein [Echinicola strongylocentroti]
MKNFKYILGLLVLLCVACEETWDEHYGLEGTDETAQVVSELNLLDYLKANPDYAKFVEALEEQGIAEELTRDQYLSVWAVNNEGMEALQQMDMEAEFVLRYHINNLTYDMSKLRDGLRLRSLNGKYIPVTKKVENTIQVADATITNGNQFCQNGVVHEISELMVPDESIYNYVYKLSDDFSMIRDSVFAANDTVFDAQNSIPIGVDKSGNTIYDSAFVIENPIFEEVDFRSEFSQVTMFVPSNQVVANCFDNLQGLYDQFGKPFTREDSLTAWNWIMDAVFYDEVVEDYGTEEDLISAFGARWKTSVQGVNTQYKRMSNGRIYDVNFLKIPNNVHISAIKQLFYYYEFVPDEQRDELFTFHNATEIRAQGTDNYSFPSLNVSGTYTILRLFGDNIPGQPLAVDYTPVKLDRNEDGTTSASVVEVPPGEYNLYMGVQSKNHPFLNVYIDDQLVASELNVEPSSPWNYDRSTNTVSGTKWDGLGGLVGVVNIEGDEIRTFKIRVEVALLGKSSREEMKLYHWALVPTQNNY